MNLDNIKIENDVNVEVKEGIFVNIKDLLNVILEFFKNLIKFEF